MTDGRVLFASRSEGKTRELNHVLRGTGLEILMLSVAGIPSTSDEARIECFSTFEENAAAKARYFWARAGGLATIADDSGLEVAALGGAPGVKSRRWSGRSDLSGQPLDDANNRTLLAALTGVTDRRARFVCAAAFCDARCELVCRGEVEGRVLDAPRGIGGFGYDPYFFCADLGRTFGEVGPAEKARVSHRGRAFRCLIERLGLRAPAFSGS